jgi:inner membrane protein
VLVTDLRMGLEPNYTFSFVVATHASPLQPVATPVAVGTRVDLGRALRWWWRRSLGESLPPPR